MSSLSSPLLHIPTKRTDEVDYGPAFRAYIHSAYQEDPDKYLPEINHLNRLRQDTRGAGKDLTGRDILYRYYGQLELLDLRFPVDEKNIKILFIWYDSFSGKSIAQHSIAYEKACTIFNIAATCSSIAALQNRFEASGLKMAFNYFQAAAGLFSYINDNFLHAPSLDLSRDSIKALADLVLAQAQECFIEKVVLEKKRGTLVAKLAAQAAHQYTMALEGLGHASLKGQFEKAWPELIKVKAKHFQAVAMYHKALQLETENKYGEIVAHLTLAETHARDAQKLANTFLSSFPSFTTSSLSNSSDSGPGQSTAAAAALVETTKINLALITDHKNRSTKDNDIIYHEMVPNPETLPPIDKLAAVKPITFSEVCAGGAADIPKIIGPDIFAKLVPLSVHESNSVYSEEKDKLVRSEKERALAADGELQASLESMDLMSTLDRLKRFVKGINAVDDSMRLPDEVRAWNQAVQTAEDGLGGQTRTDELVSKLDGLKQRVRETLDEIGRLLEKEQSACEAMRVKYMDLWTQEPSGRITSTLRADIRRHRESFDQAAGTDNSLLQRVAESTRETADLRQSIEHVESVFANVVLADIGNQAKVKEANLMDDDGVTINGTKGLNVLGEQMVVEKLDQLLSRLRSLKKERVEFLDELKQKTQQDDIAGLLLLNKNKESQIYATEIAKFKPIQAKLTANLHSHQQLLQELGNEYGRLRESSNGLKTLDGRDRRKSKIVAEWREYYLKWSEIRDGLNRGIQFYSGLSELVDGLKDSVFHFVQKRDNERNQLVKKIEDDQAERGQQALREQLRKLSVTPSSPTYQGPPSNPSLLGASSSTGVAYFQSQLSITPPSSMPIPPPVANNAIPPAPIQAYAPNTMPYAPPGNMMNPSNSQPPPGLYSSYNTGRPGASATPPAIPPNPYSPHPSTTTTPPSLYGQTGNSNHFHPATSASNYQPNARPQTPQYEARSQYTYSNTPYSNPPAPYHQAQIPSNQSSYMSTVPQPHSAYALPPSPASQYGGAPPPQPPSSVPSYGVSQYSPYGGSSSYSSAPPPSNQPPYGATPQSNYGNYATPSVPPSATSGQPLSQYNPAPATRGYNSEFRLPPSQLPSWQGYTHPAIQPYSHPPPSATNVPNSYSGYAPQPEQHNVYNPSPRSATYSQAPPPQQYGHGMNPDAPPHPQVGRRPPSLMD
ncbi:hypothetical protein SeMB42_g05962 [Synchytrium endobioticum]|uniref:BRO domain-containing protein 1 n=1 Tax=Synchytrium endobioticum TaxID=286115 RepID=A0A507CN11_9FUNG|nr:hypothetical protein SeMB42_g05962 [Synchytrium endobioticum]TPX44466.1 hypothetical protein SeLEV6574_g04484 [Synchytrium endobioticum]